MRRNESGLTLIEVLAAITILSIVGVTIWQVFFQGQEFSQKSATKNRLQQEANVVITTLTRIHQTNDQYTISNTGCELSVVDSTGKQLALFEDDKLCYEAYTDSDDDKNYETKLVPTLVFPSGTDSRTGSVQDLSLEIHMYEQYNPKNIVKVKTLLYRLKEGENYE